jgi:hypothetical protein
MAKTTICIVEDPSIIERLKKIAKNEDESLSVIYRRAVRLFLSTIPQNGNIPQEEAKETA